MPLEPGFVRGLFVGLLSGLGSQAVHWFITPMAHPDASSLREVGVALQLLVGYGGAAWLFYRSAAIARQRARPPRSA